jgi:hypothetical protein
MNQGNAECSNEKDALTVPEKLEQMIKQFKTHRCTMDFDYAFCKSIYKEQ